MTTLEARSQPRKSKNQSSPDTLDDLFSDPTLQITDIYAVSNKSKKPNSFGGIVTTDGRPALIYAFKLTVGDFPEPAGPRHFQVWGLKRGGEFDPVGLLNPRVGSGDSAVRLGKLTQDDPVADRWVLSVGDSRALAGIRYLLIESFDTGRLELYNLASDPSERKNLAVFQLASSFACTLAHSRPL